MDKTKKTFLLLGIFEWGFLYDLRGSKAHDFAKISF